MSIFFPSLSDQGWLRSSREIGDFALSHYFESDFSQTQLYLGRIKSLAYTVQVNNGNPAKTASDIESELSIYLSSMLENVTVSCTVNKKNTITSDTALNLFVSFNDNNGKKITLTNLLEVNDGKLLKVTKINNDGV